MLQRPRLTMLSLLAMYVVTPVLALAACDSAGSVGVRGNRVSTLTVKLTDAPADLSEAWVRVKKVQLVADSVAPDTAAPDTSQTSELAPDSGWINLLALEGGKTKDLFSGAVRSGRYSQVRLVVCDMYIKTTDDQIIATTNRPHEPVALRTFMAPTLPVPCSVTSLATVRRVFVRPLPPMRIGGCGRCTGCGIRCCCRPGGKPRWRTGTSPVPGMW